MDEEMYKEMWQTMRQHNLELIDDIGSDYRCTICKMILIDACTTICACRFCMDCIKEYLGDEMKMCPGESEDCKIDMINIESDIQRNRLINTRISKLKAKCPNFDCHAEIELKVMTNHLETCESRPQSCPYFELGCEEQSLMNHQAKEHLLSEIYSHTRLMMNWMNNSRNEMESLKAEMNQLRADNGWHKDETRRDREIKERIIQEMQRKEKENIREIEMLNEEMSALKNAHRRIDELQAVKVEQAEQISQLKAQILKHGEEIEQLKLDYEQEKTRRRDICQKALKSSTKPDEMSIGITHIKAESMETRKSIQIKPNFINQTSFGEFDWKIDNWSDKSRKLRNGEEKEIFSDAFLSHPNGYKICLSALHAFGFLRISFYIVRGAFDGSLRWPFDRDLEISLMNKKNGLPHRTKKMKYFDYCKTHSKELQKPINERNDPIHICHISTQESTNPEICSDDEIFLKFAIKPDKN